MRRIVLWPGLNGRMPGALVRAIVLAAIALPATVTADTVLPERDAFRALDAAVAYFYHKDTMRRKVESACYFDPQVEGSMVCPWQAGGGGADPFRMQQKVRKNGLKWCKERGGENCTLFWRNGKIKFDALAPEQLTRLETVQGNISSYDREASPLPEGVEVGSNFRNRFNKARDYWEQRRKKRRGHKLQYAICASDRGPWATSSMEGAPTAKEGLSRVRAMCILKCKAIEEWSSKQGGCYLIFEDGKFASAAAQKAVTQ